MRIAVALTNSGAVGCSRPSITTASVVIPESSGCLRPSVTMVTSGINSGAVGCC